MDHHHFEPLTGSVTGTVTVPPFKTTIDLLGIPTTVGVSFTQVGSANGTITGIPRTNCSTTKSPCLSLTVPTEANVGITAAGVFGITLLPTHCVTSEPVTFPLSTTLTIAELLIKGPSFAGTTTIPPIKCAGLEELVLAPLLTELMSGPENPYAIAIAP